MEKLKSNIKLTTGEILHLIIDAIFFFAPGMIALVYAILLEAHAFGYMELSDSDFLVTPIMVYFLILTVVYAIYFLTRNLIRKPNERGKFGGISGPTPMASFGLIAFVASLMILRFATPAGANHDLGGFFYAPALLFSGAGLYRYMEAFMNLA